MGPDGRASGLDTAGVQDALASGLPRSEYLAALVVEATSEVETQAAARRPQRAPTDRPSVIHARYHWD